MIQQRRIGVIADDFTGASDAASFLVKKGAKTVLYTDVPSETDTEADAIVMALKSRSVSPNAAIQMVEVALTYLMASGCTQFYFKYCSTFDSTPDGNIGVVLDYLMERLDVPFTVVCPSLPVNGRTVKDGILFVNGERLDESPMKHHPLNPMWDASIPNLLQPQSAYPCFVFDLNVSDDVLAERLQSYQNRHKHFTLVPDYVSDQDGERIGSTFRDLKLLSGGSALLEHLVSLKKEARTQPKRDSQKALILCGSCSAQTKRQIEAYERDGGLTYCLNANQLLSGAVTVSDIFDSIIKAHAPVLVYSDAIYDDMQILRKSLTFKKAGQCIEETLASLSVLAKYAGFNTIIAAGGETSGAVTLALGYSGYNIEESVAPGVPVMAPLDNLNLRIVLKSGNFGSDSFFSEALEATR